MKNNHPILRLFAMFVALTVPAGCATYDRTRQSVEHAARDWQRDRATIQADRKQPDLDQQTAPGMEDDAGSPADLARPVDAYVREALSRNPGIQSAVANARAKLERIPQVTSLPDPILRTVTRPEPIQTAAGDVRFTLAVSQTIPLLAKLERAGNVAAAETREALEQLSARRAQVIADVERAWWQIYRLDRYVEITRDNRRVLEDLGRVVETQYQVGKVPQEDLLRVQTELGKLRDDEHRFAVQRAAAVAALNQLTDHPPQREIPTIAAVDATRVDADVDRLLMLAAEHNPELATIRERRERDREQVELAKLGYWPDVTVGFEWNYLEGRGAFIPPVNPMTGARPPINRASEVGDDNWAIMVQINVPIWVQRIEAAKRESRQRLLATHSELRAAENMVAFRIVDAWSRVEAQQHTLRVLDTELLPQSRQTYEVTLTAYQSGDAEFVTLIDNWRRWLDFELMRHRETVDLETAYADMQREVGLQLIHGDGASLPDGD